MQRPTDEWLISYSGQSRQRCPVACPETLDELAALLGEATRAGKSVTFRGGGLSFDAQAMGGELAVDLRSFAGIEVDESAQLVTVGGGARWGAIVDACAARGLMPPVVVTTRAATAAGTLSSNGLSRFSTLHGKEGRSVERFELMDVSGTLHRCSRTENSDIFFAAIGGFGGLGAIVRITYRLLDVGAKPPRVRSRVVKHANLSGLAATLRAPSERGGAEAVYAVLTESRSGPRALVSHSSYCDAKGLVQMLPHRGDTLLRTPIEWLLHWWQPMGPLLWNYAFDHYVREDRPYIDDLDGYTFLMEGNLRAHRAASRFGIPFGTIQQSYVVPDGGAGAEPLDAFLADAFSTMREARLRPTVVDVLHLPADDEFLLSSTRGLAGHVVTLTFEGLRKQKLARIERLLIELGDRCAALGGRIHLTKNVYARAGLVESTYREGMTRYAAIKARLDPKGLLRSAFLERLFPEHFAR
jgi:FAD/FMN-containing dehydrogenase